MKCKSIIASAVTLVLFLSGCSSKYDSGNWALPADAGRIEMKDYEDIGMMGIEYNGRVYHPYGTVAESVSGDSIRDCIGYLDDDRNDRLYLLSEDPKENYLMEYYTAGIMEQPVFWRAMDTYGKDVFTPSYIESLGYEEWMSSGSHSEVMSFDLGVICDADNIYEISYQVIVNGESIGIGGCHNADGSVIDRGELLNLSIDEFIFEDKVDTGKPFDVTIEFTATDADGEEHEVEGVFEGEIMLGTCINNMIIESNKEGGLRLVTDR